MKNLIFKKTSYKSRDLCDKNRLDIICDTYALFKINLHNWAKRDHKSLKVSSLIPEIEKKIMIILIGKDDLL